MKSKLCLLLLVMSLVVTLPAQSADIKGLLSQIGFKQYFEKDAKAEITKVIEKQQKYANHKNYKKLKLVYTSDYSNFDGINLDDYIASVQKTWDMHSKLNYTTTINSINVNGDYATVQVTDTAVGETKESYENIKGKGALNSISSGIYYFKRVNGDWKISSDMIFSEKTTLKYGSAIDMDITLEAPECVKAASQYDVKINAAPPAQSAVIASIVSEPIQYPQIKARDIFRSVKQDGELQRVITANSDGKNEVAFASIAIAKAVEAEDKTMNVQVDGVAFVASRVNVIPMKKSEETNE